MDLSSSAAFPQTLWPHTHTAHYHKVLFTRNWSPAQRNSTPVTLSHATHTLQQRTCMHACKNVYGTLFETGTHSITRHLHTAQHVIDTCSESPAHIATQYLIHCTMPHQCFIAVECKPRFLLRVTLSKTHAASTQQST